MKTVYLGIGSNLGDREGFIHKAISLLGQIAGVKVAKISSLYETDPVGGPPQGKFLNGALQIQTDLTPLELLNQLKSIEQFLGRRSRIKNGPREIDLDILIYADQRIQIPELQIPHPRMMEREFVLHPLREIALHDENLSIWRLPKILS